MEQTVLVKRNGPRIGIQDVSLRTRSLGGGLGIFFMAFYFHGAGSLGSLGQSAGRQVLDFWAFGPWDFGSGSLSSHMVTGPLRAGRNFFTAIGRVIYILWRVGVGGPRKGGGVD